LGKVVVMNEYETNPQRHEASSSEGLSHQPADAPQQDSGIPAGGQSSYAEEPTAPQPAAVAPQSSAPQSSTPQSAPQSAAPQPAAPQPAAPQAAAPQSVPPQHHQWAPPWHHQQQTQPTAQQPTYPGYQPQQPGYQQPTYQAQHPQYAYAGQAAGSAPPAQDGQTWSQPAEGPAWAQPVEGPVQDPERSRRTKRILATGAAAVVLALAAGGVGAATALAFDGNNGSTGIKTSNSSVERVVDRSSLAQIASALRDSVVSITTASGEGSGVIVDASGNIVTNNHVVATAQGTTVNVIFASGKKSVATIVGTDPRTDLAVVRVQDTSGLKPASWGSSANMQVGDTVLAIGSPLGLEGSVTQGIISAKDRTIQSASEQSPQQNPYTQQQQQSSTTMSGLLQTDAPINPGNSGGALVNTDGKVIGINSAIATSGSGNGNIGLGFAIPSDKVQLVVNALIAGQKVKHPALNISVTPAEGGGALISAVTANGAAAKAGLQQGDVITQVNGKVVNSSEDLIGDIQSANVGDQVTIKFTRNGAEKTVTVTLGDGG
jgi:putative serine protease PepD